MTHIYNVKLEVTLSMQEPFADKEEAKEFLRDLVEQDGGEIAVSIANMGEVKHWEEDV